MGMFRRQAEAAAPLGSTGYTVLDAHVVVRGDIETNGTLRIDGRLEGNVLRAGSVVIGPTGSVVGNVFATEMVLGGSINGNVDVDRREQLHLRQQARHADAAAQSAEPDGADALEQAVDRLEVRQRLAIVGHGRSSAKAVRNCGMVTTWSWRTAHTNASATSWPMISSGRTSRF